MTATSPCRPPDIVMDPYQLVNPSTQLSAVSARLWWFLTSNQFSESKIAIIGNEPEALLLSILFAEAGRPNYLVGRFDEAKTKRTDTGGLGEARWLLGVHRKTGTTTLLSGVEALSANPPSIIVLTGHAVSQREISELEITTRAICKLISRGTSLTFTGLCRPNFTDTTLRQADGDVYCEALDRNTQSGTDNLAIPSSFVVRDAIASNIAIGSSGSRGNPSVVRAARRINEAGEQKVLELVKSALSLCGKR